MSWRVATSLDVLLNEINAEAPNRSKASDGSIGDAAHASRASDHNPWRDGETVGARDFTHDPAGGLDCVDLATHLAGLIAAGEHPALRSGAYIIWRSRILSTDRRSEGWRTYTGSNPHDKHLHLSVATEWADFETTRPWGWADQEDEMTQYAEQLDRIETNGKQILKEQRAERQARGKTLAGMVERQKRIATAVRKRATQEQAEDIATELEQMADEVAALVEVLEPDEVPA